MSVSVCAVLAAFTKCSATIIKTFCNNVFNDTKMSQWLNVFVIIIITPTANPLLLLIQYLCYNN